MFQDLNIEFDNREFSEFSAANSENSFDVVVTCFFLDTTVDIASYVAMIKRLVKPGGFWINCGPLMYHYGSERSVAMQPRWRELNAEEVVQTIESSGFRISEKSEIETEYLGNPRSLMSTKHKCMFFVASRS
jgi:carnosine N-methyltransferase